MRAAHPAPRRRTTYAPRVAHFAKVLTVSDRVSGGAAEDLSGPALCAQLENAGFEVVAHVTVPDGVASVAGALEELADGFSGLIVTTGGTGFSPRDLTPEATASVLERDAPGLGEAMRRASPLGALSRGRAGTIGACLIVNTPGSTRGARESLDAILGVLPHALALLAGVSGQHPPEIGGSTASTS